MLSSTSGITVAENENIRSRLFLAILSILISSYFAKHSFSIQHILISTHSKCQFSYNKLSFSYSKKSFLIFLSSQNIILILNLTISNISIQTSIFIQTHSKLSTYFIYSIQNGQNDHNNCKQTCFKSLIIKQLESFTLCFI